MSFTIMNSTDDPAPVLVYAREGEDVTPSFDDLIDMFRAIGHRMPDQWPPDEVVFIGFRFTKKICDYVVTDTFLRSVSHMEADCVIFENCRFDSYKALETMLAYIRAECFEFTECTFTDSKRIKRELSQKLEACDFRFLRCKFQNLTQFSNVMQIIENKCIFGLFNNIQIDGKSLLAEDVFHLPHTLRFVQFIASAINQYTVYQYADNFHNHLSIPIRIALVQSVEGDKEIVYEYKDLKKYFGVLPVVFTLALPRLVPRVGHGSFLRMLPTELCRRVKEMLIKV